MHDFQSLREFRNRLTSVQSLADLNYDVSKVLIEYGEVLDKRYAMGNSGTGENSARSRTSCYTEEQAQVF